MKKLRCTSWFWLVQEVWFILPQFILFSSISAGWKNYPNWLLITKKEMEKYPYSVTIGPTVCLFSPKTWAGRQRFCPDNSFLSYSMILSCNCKPHSASSEHLQHKLLAYIHSMNNLIIMSSIEWNCKTKIMWMWYNDFEVIHLRWWQELIYSTL